ncbi:MAG: multifunctional CCA addition/repair protein [Betaproteobacteria bacterium]
MARTRPQPFQVFRVGGSVRDELLGRPDADRDFVVVGATPELMIASGYRPVGRDFPVFLHPETHEEYALARTERKHGRGYRGFEFFASPEVTLAEDLIRRDLTINAMARGDDGILVDPFGGAADLAAGLLRHVSPAFAEDPLRVLRVARFAARFGFSIAPATEALMRSIVASGELATISPERIWQELSKGLTEIHPSRLLATLRECGALAHLMPEVDALYGVAQPPEHHPEVDAGVHVAMALDWSAAHEFSLAARYAILAQNLGKAATSSTAWPRHVGQERASVRLAQQLSNRLRVPQECADAARLAARWHRVVHRAAELRPATCLDFFNATDALRRPERLDVVLDASMADACSRPGAAQDYPPATVLRDALAVVKSVDAGAIARQVVGGTGKSVSGRGRDPGDAIAKALRSARLAALRAWRRSRGVNQSR